MALIIPQEQISMLAIEFANVSMETFFRDVLLFTVVGVSLFLILAGLFRLLFAVQSYRARHIDARYRAAVLVVTEDRKLRAAQHRAAEREWCRARFAEDVQ